MEKLLVLSNVGGGLYAFRGELLIALIAQGYEIYTATIEGNYLEKLKDLGCKVKIVPMNRRGTNPIKDIVLLLRYIKLIQELKPNAVLTYTIKPNIYGGIACRVTKTPYYSNITGLGTSIQNPGLLQKLSLLLYKIGLKKARCIFFQNQNNLNFMKENGASFINTKLLPGSGVNMKTHPYRQYPQEQQKISFLTAGRIMKDKGTDELLACAKYIHHKYPDVTFNLAGGFDEESYRLQIESLEAEGAVNFLGWRTDILDLMASHHAILHPSYHEGMSNALLDAAAIGRPVIATNVPGCSEIFDEGITGFGVPAKNAEALIEAVERFINLSHQEKEKMGQAARQKMINEFDRDIVVKAYMEEIGKVMRDKP